MDAYIIEPTYITQVKQHMFFKDINWDTLARQKVSKSVKFML